MTHSPASLSEIVDRVIETAHAHRLDVDSLLDAVGRASFTPVLLLPALAVATPLSGIPFFSSSMGIIIALVSAQMLFRRHHLWLPSWVLKREVNGQTVRHAFLKVRPMSAWIDRHTTQRFRVFVRRPLIFIPQSLCLLSGLMMPLLEFVPFSSSALGIGVVLLALSMLARDGALMVVALLPYGLAIWLIVRFVG
ncbi:MAG: exopolysaccharide biosynthesis protein [Hyphomicrobiales bacterium]